MADKFRKLNADEIEVRGECLKLLAIFERGIGVTDEQKAGSHAGEAACRVTPQAASSAPQAVSKRCIQSSPEGRMR